MTSPNMIKASWFLLKNRYFRTNAEKFLILTQLVWKWKCDFGDIKMLHFKGFCGEIV